MTWRACLCALVLSLGCGDPPSGDDDDDAIDAAVGPMTDAPVPDASVPDAGPDATPAADLTLNLGRAIADLSIEEESFDADACELDPDEACIGAPGNRRLLRFAVETPNIGLEDLFLGTPNPSNPLFEYSECHGHYHFEGYATYSLQTLEGDEVSPGRKQAFCLLDWQKYLVDDPTVSDDGQYHCGYQGIQRGWSDVYEARLPCQYVDITDVPDGDYILRVELNADRALEEMSYDNNTVEIPVTIGDPDLEGPTEDCPPEVDSFAGDGTHRECGWESAGVYACDPGTTFRVGCAEGCSLGSCTGDPIMRVCDAADPDGNCSATQNIDDDDDSSCGGNCPRIRNARCPASGQVEVFTAPHALGEAYTCVVELQ